jgi:hypothetical protein
VIFCPSLYYNSVNVVAEEEQDKACSH